MRGTLLPRPLRPLITFIQVVVFSNFVSVFDLLLLVDIVVLLECELSCPTYLLLV